MPRATAKSFARIALLLAPLSLGLAACETLENLNPFDDTKKTPLSGDRRSVFPQGVPGVQYNAPPTQPSNSNIQVAPQEIPDQNPQVQTQTQPQNVPNTKRGPQNNSDDPWAGQRR
jgi:hypothetical protein